MKQSLSVWTSSLPTGLSAAAAAAAAVWPPQQSAQLRQGSTAPPGALLCPFKYSRQCCWPVWRRRAHGAALPLRSVEQKNLLLSHVGRKIDRSTQTPASHIQHCCCELRALRGAAEEGGDEEGDCVMGTGEPAGTLTLSPPKTEVRSGFIRAVDYWTG